MLSFIAERAAEDAPALVRPGGEQMTYGTLAMAAAAVRQALEARVGDVARRVVGVAVDDAAGFVASVLAVLEAGGVVMPLDLSRGVAALQEEAARARAVAVIVGDAAEDRLDVVAGDPSRRELDVEACLLVDTTAMSAPNANAPNANAPNANAPNAGGARAVHSRRSLGLGVDAVVAQLGLDASARVPLLGAPVQALTTTILPTLRAGGTLLALAGIRVVDQAAGMARLGATVLTGPAATLAPIAVAATSSTISAARSAGVAVKRVVLVGGAVAGVDTIAGGFAAGDADETALLRRAFPGARLTRAVDAPETLRVAAGESAPLRPLPGVRVAAADGYVLVHSPTMMMGYLDAPEATRAAFVEREALRWVRTTLAREGLLVE